MVNKHSHLFSKVLSVAQKMPADQALAYRELVSTIFLYRREPPQSHLDQLVKILGDQNIDSAPVMENIREYFSLRQREFIQHISGQ